MDALAQRAGCALEEGGAESPCGLSDRMTWKRGYSGDSAEGEVKAGKTSRWIEEGKVFGNLLPE